MKNIFTTAIALLITFMIPGNIFGQPNSFEKGYYITQQGDTVRGLINLHRSSKSLSFSFKNDKTQKEEIPVSFESCKQISLNNEILRPWTGTRSATFIDRFTYEIKYVDSVITETILLKQVYKGFPISLYRYQDERDYYFIEVNNSISELRIKYRYLTEWEKLQYTNVYQMPRYFTNETYKSQLVVLMENNLTKKQIAMINQATYDKASLTRLIKVLSKPTAKQKYKVSY